MDSSDFYLLSEDAAKAIGVAPQNCVNRQRTNPKNWDSM